MGLEPQTERRTDEFDLVVAGGGINGTGIAAEAARRGYRVALFEADDLAGATSSASSKLIHGGLRYLEHYEFRLVREALAEREILLAKAPHIIWPMRFVLPHAPGMRPAWMLRTGLWLYDHLANRKTLPASRALNLERSSAGVPLKPEFASGFSYWDCWVDDARLVVSNALAARAHGAEIATRTAVTGATVRDGKWIVTVARGNNRREVRALAFANAAGPWAGDVARLVRSGSNMPAPKLRLVRGSHIVVPKLSSAEDAYIFQNEDGRVIFALPFEEHFTIIGTTDEPHHADARGVAPSEAEEAYLLQVANRYFRQAVSLADIVWRFAGVRPLEDDGSDNPSAVTRDYRLDLDQTGGAPLLNVIGGKITTYRRLALAAVDALGLTAQNPVAPLDDREPLPGGDVGSGGFDEWFNDLSERNPDIAAATLRRLARRYGTRCEMLLDGVKTERGLGSDFGGGLNEREVDFLKAEEWAETADDVLWRRTKAGLHIPMQRRRQVAEAVQQRLDGADTRPGR